MTSGGAETNPSKPNLGGLLVLASIPLAFISVVLAFSAGTEEPFMGGARRPLVSFWYLGLGGIILFLWIEWSILLLYFVIRRRLRAWSCIGFLWALFWGYGFCAYVVWEYSGDVWRWETHWVPKWTEQHRAKEAAEAAKELQRQLSPPSTAPSPEPNP